MHFHDIEEVGNCVPDGYAGGAKAEDLNLLLYPGTLRDAFT
jgi:hypothetical protein